MSDIFPLTDHPAILRTFATPNAIADNLIVAAAAGRKIKVLAGLVVNNVATANTVTWKSGSTALGPGIVLPASTFGLVPWPYNEAGWLLTNTGEALNLALSAATAVAVSVIYVLV